MSTRIGKYCRAGWNALRSVLGDDAYERYLAHVKKHHGETQPLGREPFYRSELDRRWSQINRCC